MESHYSNFDPPQPPASMVTACPSCGAPLAVCVYQCVVADDDADDVAFLNSVFFDI